MAVVSDIRKQIERRISELEPLVAEYHQLQRMLSGLDDFEDSAPAKRTPRKRDRSRATAGRRRTGTRADESVRIVRERPGITASEIAETMGIDVNYLYRVLPRLEREGAIVRQGRGWHVADAPRT
jgi:CRP-like cAMP-binding protein